MASAAALATAAESKDPAIGLAAVAALRRLAEELEALHVDSARAAGWSWQEVADALGVTRQTVHKKHHVRRGAAEGPMMFENLDVQARRAVDVAIGEAHELGHGWFGTEHVLIGILSAAEALPEAARILLPSAEAVRDRLRQGLRGPGSCPSDEELLASLGIDLAEVRRRAAATFGAQVVERTAGRARVFGWRRLPPRRCERPRRMVTLPGESLAMAPRLKCAFEQARRGAGDRGLITPPALLAAVLSVDDALAPELLALMGVDVARVRAALDQ